MIAVPYLRPGCNNFSKYKIALSDTENDTILVPKADLFWFCLLNDLVFELKDNF